MAILRALWLLLTGVGRAQPAGDCRTDSGEA
jgi:hypothetical protein